MLTVSRLTSERNEIEGSESSEGMDWEMRDLYSIKDGLIVYVGHFFGVESIARPKTTHKRKKKKKKITCFAHRTVQVSSMKVPTIGSVRDL